MGEWEEIIYNFVEIDYLEHNHWQVMLDQQDG